MAYERPMTALTLVLFAIFLDCLDGDLARYRYRPSLSGTYLEQLAHWIGNMGLAAGAGAAIVLADPRPGNVLLASVLVVVQAVYITVVRQIRPDAAEVIGHPRLRKAFRRITKGIWNLSPIELPMIVLLVVFGVTEGVVLALTVTLAALSALVFVPHFALVSVADRRKWEAPVRLDRGPFTEASRRSAQASLHRFPDAQWWAPGMPRLPPEVLTPLGRQPLSSDAPVMTTVWRELSQLLPGVFRTSGRVLTLTGPREFAIEAVLSTICHPADEILIVGGRTTVRRWSTIAERLGVRTAHLETSFGAALQRSDLETALRRHPALRAVCVSQAEADDGTLTELAMVAETLRRTSGLFVVDACLSLCADDLRMDDWGIDIAVSSSDSGAMAPPGLSLVALGPQVLGELDGPATNGARPAGYLNLRTHVSAGDRPLAQLPAPAVSGLYISVQMTLTTGLDSVLAHHQRIAARFRRGCVEEAGLALIASHPTAACTTALLPNDVDVTEVQNSLFVNRRIVAGYATTPKNDITLQFGHVGFLSHEDVDEAIAALATAVSAARANASER
ncbi:aminotransferase class V-fold PLP-dependent enzyme [Nocardiopsis exhalans]|uniref:Aminotransferase class V-fold PLP-dependent enzyme n=1 Tax=Nocardiopsis exhalans TaxID=163604 RepID=A0ABY5D9Q8_9ACTN|nr:aminotransferase class V-fold PLP-dependent enzyme [Nocardiopsis exhalans]USY20466.1 aminotransferase class V-fold PLP-dependent enzyme [Nocardiopsis exhalans]